MTAASPQLRSTIDALQGVIADLAAIPAEIAADCPELSAADVAALESAIARNVDRINDQVAALRRRLSSLVVGTSRPNTGDRDHVTEP